MSEAVLLATAAALLEQGRGVDRLSRAITAATLIGLVLFPLAARPSWVLTASIMLVALAGLAEAYFAIRVGFDAALFRQVASAPTVDFAAMDAALSRLGLLRVEKLGRPAQPRIAGARRLLALQVSAFAVQVVLAFGCAGLALARP
jgi:hypothetical protein